MFLSRLDAKGYIHSILDLLDAIDKDDPSLIKEELGDLLFQLIFLSQLYEEKGTFTLSQVITNISNKMVARHPHVFNEKEDLTEDEQSLKWNQIKAKEKKEIKNIADLLDNVPKSLPGLRRAQRVSERAAHNGFEWQNIEAALSKLEEEVRELKEAIQGKKSPEIFEELGDCLFVLVNLGRLTKNNTEDALHSSTDKFIHRFGLLENKIVKSGKKIPDITYQDLISIWNEIKKGLT